MTMSILKDIRLPDKPSELLRLALADLIKAEKRPDTYNVRMDVSHLMFGGVCHVCLAGAVMAGTLGADPEVELLFDDDSFTADQMRKFDALDEFRRGRLDRAFESLELSEEQQAKAYKLARSKDGMYPITMYSVSPQFFKEDISKLADELEREGL